MGERDGNALALGFNGSVRVFGTELRITADGGAVLLRELDDALGLTRAVANRLEDARVGPRFSHEELLRLRVYLLVLGYGTQSDADLMRGDPSLRLAVSGSRGLSPLGKAIPSQATVSRFTRLLASEAGREALDQGLVDSALRAIRLLHGGSAGHILDIDSLPIPAHGLQGGSEYNGYYRRRCFHPQVVMDGSGHLIAVRLRPGNESSSSGATELLEEAIDRMEASGERVKRVRGDAGFPTEELLSALEARQIGYAFRVTNNPKLDEIAQPYLVRPRGRRPRKPREWTHVFRYKAARWSRERRVVLVVQERPDDLFLHYFFLVTGDETTTGRQVLGFYRQRGTMEAHLGEWVNTVSAALSSSHRDGSLARPDDDTPFQVNAATLRLSALAYNLLHTLRVLAAKARLSQIGPALGLGRARRILLSVAGRLIVSARQASLLVPSAVAEMWSLLLARLRRTRAVVVPA